MNVQPQPIRTAAEQALLALLERRLAGPAVDGPLAGRIGELRRAAHAAFAANGLPHRRVEEWKYTDLRGFLREAAPAATALGISDGASAPSAVAFPGARRILFVDGQLSPAGSDLADLEPGLTVVPLAQAMAVGRGTVEKFGTLAPQRYDGVLALNTAFFGDGLVIQIADGAKIERPLHVAHLVTHDHPVATYTRRLVEVGEGAAFTLVESFEGRSGVPYQVNDALELFVGDTGHMDYVRLQDDSETALHLSTVMVDIGRDAKFHAFGLTTGAIASRVSLYGRFSGTHSHAGIRGVTLLKDRQHADVTLLLDHAVAHCESRELFKTVLFDETRGVFQGKIVVRPDAQKTDGRMMSQALLIGETAEMDNKPELEIFADDVQCGHGATAGALDEDLLFYLKARGLPAKEAEALLIQAFVGEALEFVEEEGLREALIARAERWLNARTG
ncbi:Fe-S cluster assembly protein SufD [Aquabacter spiritensis]|uniref:Fe-S cluster assembly protein SufD n=1 Tax=Aquabacter spiritensis TaxID=933073 RepID=A0A4R3LS88_9HYPH|nr:Fe-S cluster assembly protein SufD [Aquabacter spiritensis]TCT03221.1 Fe-S cluster assembly protein SufD [Aquabacter spiritensis]